MLIDTHAHLYDNRFQQDLEAVLLRAQEAGVKRIVLPAVDVPSVHQALDLCARYEGIYVMAAIHLTYIPEAGDYDFDEITFLCDESNVIAMELKFRLPSNKYQI